MSGAIFEGTLLNLRPFLACVFAGFAIKIMDDYLDGPLDALVGKISWSTRLEKGALPYALMVFCLGVAADDGWAVTLFWASYALGMRGDLQRSLLSRLTGWQEIVLTGLCISAVYGSRALGTSWLAVFIVQAWDDLLDKDIDKLTGAHNWAIQWGSTETAISLVIAVSLLSLLHPVKLLLVLISYILITRLMRLLISTGGRADVDTDIVVS
ncbi:MAG: hypothetical protein GX316_06835 [Firmicutes bacterium]|nr:hypothetical protein [Bacillota bacterium]